ncbi:unnamed protein product [Diamesa hyperborea]
MVYKIFTKFSSLSRIKTTNTNNRRLSNMSNQINYLNQEQAINVDLELFNDYKFSVDQLMELAGLACAHSIAKVFPIKKDNENKVLVIAGPGNNGGDGLVLARHLSLMNFKPSVYYPKRTEKLLFQNLLHQCKSMGIEILESCPDKDTVMSYQLIADALFGFSFKPPIRDSFIDVMSLMIETKVPIASVDIPSGWDVENGPSDDGKSFSPYLLISLTAPKLCAKKFKGIHYLGGRFVPKNLAAKYQLNLPEYPGVDCCMELK